MTAAERLRVAADLLDEVGLRPEVRVGVQVESGISVVVLARHDSTPTDSWRAFVEIGAALTDALPPIERYGRCFREGTYRGERVTVVAHDVSPATVEVDR